MPFKYSNIFKRIWHDPVGSNLIASAFSVLGGALLVYLWNGSGSDIAAQRASPPASSSAPAGPIKRYPAVTLEELKNLTYQIDNDRITLNEGKREFIPDSDLRPGIHEKTIVVFLTDYAFGDLNGDGNEDAVAVLQVSDGGSGIYYYLAPVFNEMGTPAINGPAYVLGDRLVFRSVVISQAEVDVQLMMHRTDDPLCCPSVFRHLRFAIANKSLQCRSEPCSEI